MTQNETEWRDRVVALIAEIREIDPGQIEGRSRLREDLGMDSLNSLELLSELASELDVDLRIEEAMGLETVDDACAFVAKSMRTAYGRAS